MIGLRITPELCASTYDLLHITRPFIAWNLPDSEDILFKVDRRVDRRGAHQFWDNKHTIWMSAKCNARLNALIETMAHEMVHVFEAHTGIKGYGEHGKAFQKLSEQVCRHHGFDLAMF
jgi:hypothetical protein